MAASFNGFFCPAYYRTGTQNYELLTKKLEELTAVPPGSYALFHHNAYVWERISDIELIFTRLIDNRQLLTELNKEEQMLRQENSPTYAEWMRVIFSRSLGIHQQMKLDMESLFIFGNLLLDQWAYDIAYLVGREHPEDFNFFRLADQLQGRGDKGLLQPLWDNHHKDMIWLLYQIRNYRNIFIEHVRAPWQRSTSIETPGDSFRLESLAPVDWVTRDEIRRAVKKIRYLAPEWARSPEIAWYTDNPRQLLEIIFFYIDEIKEKPQREKVWDVWRIVGGWTCSYDMIAFRLMRFMAESMLTMLDIVTKHPEKINVGEVKTSQA